MLAKTSIALAVVLATASASLAATRHHTPAPAAQSLSNPSVTDPDAAIRFDLKRDADHGRY